jgi:tetratricopeptide (TPR) repeat protein
VNENADDMLELDEWSQDRELLPRLLQLPLGLVQVDDFERALEVARAFAFIDPESLNGDIAIIFAEAGKRDEALAQVEFNREKFPESSLTAIKSGAAFEALGDLVNAEATYRTAVELAKGRRERKAALDLLVDLLEDMGRVEEVRALRSPPIDSAPRAVAKLLATVGRNDPCPCGNGKKYKKCHGA